MQRNSVDKCSGKTRDCRKLQLLVFGVPPHETKNKTMVVNELGDGPSLINHHLDKREFSPYPPTSNQCNELRMESKTKRGTYP